MPIPLPEQFSQRPGGAFWNVFNQLNTDVNANRKAQLENQFYAPLKQAEIAHSNALTNRSNQLLPFDVQHQQLVNQFYAPNIQSEIAQRGALTNKLNTMTPLEAEQLRLQNQFYPELTKSQIQAQNALSDYRKMGGGGLGTGGKEEFMYRNFVAQDNPQLKSPEQIYEAANVLAEGGNQLSDGTKLNPLSSASQRSLDRLNKGTTTAGAFNQSLRANQAHAELQVMSKMIAEDFAPYADTYAGMSPQQIADTFKSDPASQKKLGRFIASQAGQYEVAQLRNRIAGGEPGITATQELMGKSGQIINTHFPRLSAVARIEATKRLDEYLAEGLKARNKVGVGGSSVKKFEQEAKQESKPVDYKWNAKTGRLEAAK